MTESFGKNSRLLTAKDYKAVFDQAEVKASNKDLLILGIQNKFSNPRLGLIVAKKNAKRAVDRNRLKRIIREQFRLNQTLIGSKDIVVLARPNLVNLDNRAVKKSLTYLFKKLGKNK